jgi:hypothetical protein
MNPSDNLNGPTPTDEDGSLDPRAAATLLEQTQRTAQHQLSATPPLLSLVSAVVVLVVYGSIWLSVRGQHPYVGPNLGVIGIVYALVAVGVGAGILTYRRATHGVSGRSRREDKITAIPVVVSITAVYVFMGALKFDGFSQAVVYGVFDAAAPWLVAGAVLAGLAAAREDWWKLAGGLSLVVVAAAAAFAGPINVWGTLAVCGCLLLIAQSVIRYTTGRHA